MQKKHYLLIMIAALSLSLGAQRYVERRRVEQNLIMTDPGNKVALESGFLALGGFRGLLVDILWVRAIRLQDNARYYELKLLCDLIQRLQPSFTQVHAFLAFNQSYNLAFRAISPEDKWYWITSGLATLEKGLERNRHHYSLWFELGMQYADRLSDVKIGSCRTLRQKELPNIDEIPEAERASVFLKHDWTPGHARENEHARWAAYYFYQALQATGDPLPLRTERMFGHCLTWLGYWHSKKPLTQYQNGDEHERKSWKWDDWGSEDWFVELLARNKKRGNDWDDTVSQCLRWNMLEMIDTYQRRAEQLAQINPVAASAATRQATAAEERFRRYFPNESKSMADLLNKYRQDDAKVRSIHKRGKTQ
ncbi:MAG: hypothetical protein V1899_02430 [Planctomycetota bacterium]